MLGLTIWQRIDVIDTTTETIHIRIIGLRQEGKKQIQLLPTQWMSINGQFQSMDNHDDP